MKSAGGALAATASGQPLWRASFVKTVLLLVASAILVSTFFPPAGQLVRGVSSCFHTDPRTIEQRVKRILTDTPLIDGHNDFAILTREVYGNHIYNANFTKHFEDGGMIGHVDLPRLRAGMNGGAFWSVFWPCPENGSDYSDGAYASSVLATLQQIDLMARVKDAYPGDFSPSRDSASALAAFRDSGRLVSPLGIEGLHQIGNSAANLRLFHSLGVRYATLTHNCGNRPEGRKLVNEMNRIGMIVDLSHTSVDTMRDILGGGRDGWQGSQAPVIFSHSSAYSLCPHPRNVPDDVLELVRERNSLVMVNFAPAFVSCVDAGRDDGLPDFYPPNSTLSHVVDHILHIGNLVGFDHVGVGSDFDGIADVPKGLEDVSKYPALVAELLERGVSDEDAAKVVGGNIIRVWKDVEAVASGLQKANEPVLEDDLPRLFAEQIISTP